MAKGARFLVLFKADLPRVKEGKSRAGREGYTTEHAFRINMRSGVSHEGRLVLEDRSVDGLIGVMESDNSEPTYFDPDLVESVHKKTR